MQTFFIAPAQHNVGLTSIALGVVRALQRQGLKIGFVKPVANSPFDFERSIHFARTICHIHSPNPLPADVAFNRIANGQNNDLLEDIMGLCMQAAKNADLLVIEGLYSDVGHTLAFHLNTDIVRSLQAKTVFVIDASAPEAMTGARLTASQFKAEGCQIAGLIFNKAPPHFLASEAESVLGSIPVWGIVTYSPSLIAPRTLDIARHLDAEIVVEGELHQRRVYDPVIAARSVTEVIPRLKEGALVISAGDRDDVILATALSESNGVQLAGLLLTHHSAFNERVQKLTALAFSRGLPILRTDGDSFGTATLIHQLPSAVPADDEVRINAVLDVVAEHLSVNALLSEVGVPVSTHMSPPAFRYRLIQKARSAKKTIVLPEGEEPRTIRAALICEEKGIAHCVLLGQRKLIETVASSQGLVLPDCLEIQDPQGIREQYIEPMVHLRQHKGLNALQAATQLEDSVVLGTMMLALDHVDGLVSGAVHTTANTVRPALQLIKTLKGSSIVSSVFFMLMPDQVLVYGDCAINPNPTAEQLAEIALQSADSAAAFGIVPKVAMISYSTGQSGSGADVDKVRVATELARQKNPNLIIDGPLQYDAASVSDVGHQKAPNSQVAGQATVFIFPDLNTGNTTYKAVQRSANVVSVGPMLQGLRKPVNDLSRGALVDDIVFTIALTAIQAQTVASLT